jgi:hypothetical protein
MKVSQVLRPGGFGVPVEQGAEPLVLLATGRAAPAPSGTYYDRLTPAGRTSRQAQDAGLAAALWDRSAELVGVSSS